MLGNERTEIQNCFEIHADDVWEGFLSREFDTQLGCGVCCILFLNHTFLLIYSRHMYLLQIKLFWPAFIALFVVKIQHKI